MAYVSSMTYATEAQFLQAIEAAKLAQQSTQSAAVSYGRDSSGTFQQMLNTSAASYSSGTSAIFDRTVPTTADRSITSPEDLDAYFCEAADTYNLSVDLLKAVAKQESNFQSNIVSSSGAVGIMQLMPATAASLGVTDSYDAYQNIMGGANLISQLLARYNGDTSLALAAYNAGSANVDKYGGIPPFSETQNYVQKVLSYMGSDTNTVASASTAETSEDVATTVSNFIAANNISQDTVEKLLTLLEVLNA